MKIIIVGTAHPYRGGLAAFNERLAHQFQQEGHQVEIITFSLQYPSILFPGKTQHSTAPPPSDLTIERKINSIHPLNWLQVGRSINQRQPDCVIFCYWMSFMAPCFGTIARQIKNKETKKIALLHNMIPHEPSLLDRLLPSYFVQSVDGFVAMTHSVLDDVKKIAKQEKPMALSPHPLYDHYGEKLPKSVALEKLGLDPEYHYILFFGFIRAYKGLDLLLKAYADVELRQYKMKLIVAGEFYENQKPYLDLIYKNSLEDDVILHTHFIPDDKVHYYFNAADLIAQPYKTATQSGVSQIAYFYEKPMLVTNVGGLAETIPDGKVGYVVKPDVKSITNALADFAGNERSPFFIKNIKEEKKKYEWNKMTKTILSLLSRC